MHDLPQYSKKIRLPINSSIALPKKFIPEESQLQWPVELRTTVELKQ